MRSRLEARWAAFFDACDWVWSYEPIDLNMYIPDFALRLEHAPLAVEVKPELTLDGLYEHGRRIIRSGWQKEFLVLGADLFGTTIGVLGDTSMAMVVGETEMDHAVLFTCISCGKISVRTESLSWRCRVCGVDDGNAHVGELPAGHLRELWGVAGNMVQWRGA